MRSRNHVRILETLQKKVFPGMAAQREWAANNLLGKAEGTEDDVDISAFGYTKLMEMFAKSFLAGSVIVRECVHLQAQNHPLFLHPLFEDPEYISYATEVKTYLAQHKMVRCIMCSISLFDSSKKCFFLCVYTVTIEFY